MTLRSLICAAAIAAAVVDTVAGCRDLPFAPSGVLPDLPVGAETLTPLASYASWWQSVEDCAGRRGDIARVRWFTVPDRTSFVYGDSRYDGYWWGGVHWILIAGEKVNDG